MALGVAAPSGATSAPTPVTKASTSARGVSATAINVVFPVISFSSIEGQFEIESDAEYGEQTKAIHLFVNQINDAGGINGRKINPMIEGLRPDERVRRSDHCANSGPWATHLCSPSSMGSAHSKGSMSSVSPKKVTRR